MPRNPHDNWRAEGASSLRDLHGSRVSTSLRGLTSSARLFLVLTAISLLLGAEPASRRYENRLAVIADPKPLLADYPEFIEPVRETTRYEAPVLVDDRDADLSVR